MAQAFQTEAVSTVLVEGITGPGGSDRMYITTGIALLPDPTSSTVSVDTGLPVAGHAEAYAGLIEPQLEPGQFRRAAATVAISGLALYLDMQISMYTPLIPEWQVRDADADWDDESGRIELRFGIVESRANFVTYLRRVSFQVIVFAAANAEEAPV
jgi:hypothetical protein